MQQQLQSFVNFFKLDDPQAPLRGTLPQVARILIMLFVLLSPNLYNYFVPEVAGDVRWYMLGATSLLCLILLTLHAFVHSSKIQLVQLYKAPLPLYLAGFLGVIALASILWSPATLRTTFFAMHFAFYVVFFMCIYMLRSKVWFTTLISLLAISVIFNSLLGITQFLGIKDETIRHFITFWPKPLLNYFQYSAPPAGTFSNKNLAASFLVMTLPLMAWLLLVARTRTEYVVSTLALALGGLFFLYTRTRGSWLALSVALALFAVWFIIHRKTLAPVFKAYISPLKAGLVVGILSFIVAGAQLQSQLKGYHSVGESISKQVSSVANMTYSDMGTRMAYNINGIEMVKDRPFIGSGFSTFFTMYPKYHNASMPTPEHGYKRVARPQRMHNDLAQMFVELGIPAGLAWLTLFMFPLYAAWRIMRSTASHHEKAFTSILLLSLGGLSLNSLGDFPLQMPTGAMILWLGWGIMAGLYAMNCLQTKQRLISFKAPRFLALVIAIVLGAMLCLYASTMYKRNQAAWPLKVAMAHIKNQIASADTVKTIDFSFNTYPYNPRTIENKGLIYINHYLNAPTQTKTIPYDTMFEVLNDYLAEDPYSAATLINRANLNLRRAQHLTFLNDPARASQHLHAAKEDFKTLLDVLPMDSATYTTGAIVYFLEGELEKANVLYQKALKINPHDAFAKDGLNRVRVRALQTLTPISELEGAKVTLPDEMAKQLLGIGQKKP